MFRIGGYEFLVIIQNRDFLDKEKLLRELYQACDEEILISDNQKTQVSIAVGSAVYDSRIDNGFMDVFNRADSAMYENKRKIKKL